MADSRVSAARALLRWEAALVALLLLMIPFGDLLSPHFVESSNLAFLTLDVSEIALMALPLTLVIVSGEIDLSVASVLGLSSAVMGALWNANWPLQWILPGVLVVGLACGALNGLLVTRFGLPSLAVTIGTLALFRGLAYVTLGSAAVADFPASFTGLATGSWGPLPYPTVAVLVLAVVFAVLLHATPFGRSVFAIGANIDTAYFSGLRVKRIKLTLFMLTGLMSALAGIVYTFRFSSARADNGSGLELAVVAAVLLGGVSIFGGRGSVPGVVLAVFFLGAIRNALTLDDISNEILTIVTGFLLIGSVLAPRLARAAGQRSHRRRSGPSPPVATRVEAVP